MQTRLLSSEMSVPTGADPSQHTQSLPMEMANVFNLIG